MFDAGDGLPTPPTVGLSGRMRPGHGAGEC